MKAFSLRPLLSACIFSLILSSCSVSHEVSDTTLLQSNRLQAAQGLSAFKNQTVKETSTSTPPQEVVTSATWIPSHLKHTETTLLKDKVSIRSIRKGLIKKHFSPALGDCDAIILFGGEQIKAKVLEVDATEIKYKKCDNPDGPIYTVSTSKVREISYSNGTSEIISSETGNEDTDKIAPLMKVNYFLLWFLMLVGAFLSYLIALGIGVTTLTGTGTAGALAFATILGSFFIFIGYLFGIAFLVFFVLWLLKLVS